MVNPNRPNVYAGRHVYMKRRIYAAQRRSKWIGIMYLIATLLVTALACVPHMPISDPTLPSNVSVFAAIDVFGVIKNLSGNVLPFVVTLVIAILYAVLFVNILRSFVKLGWLFKKKASRLYGFNRNMYAMDDMGRIYSCTLSTILIFHFFVVLLAEKVEFDYLTAAMLGVGVFFHFLLGMLGGNVSIFDTEAHLIEIKRECGNFSVFVRNFIQLGVVGVLAYCLFKDNAILPFVQDVSERGRAAFKGDLAPVVMAFAQLALLAVWAFMAIYATGVKEFDMEGKHTVGRKTFLVLSVFATLLAGGAYVYGKYVAKSELGDGLLSATIVSLVSLVAEMALMNFPKDRSEADEEIPLQCFKQGSGDQPNLELYPPAQYAPPYYGDVQGDDENCYRQNYGYYGAVNTHYYDARRMR